MPPKEAAPKLTQATFIETEPATGTRVLANKTNSKMNSRRKRKLWRSALGVNESGLQSSNKAVDFSTVGQVETPPAIHRTFVVV